jgi:hypothetical protein
MCKHAVSPSPAKRGEVLECGPPLWKRGVRGGFSLAKGRKGVPICTQTGSPTLISEEPSLLCFDRLSMNGKRPIFSIRIPFALSTPKRERAFAG